MNLYSKSSSFYFVSALSFTLLSPVILPWMRLAYFVPFIILLFYKKPFAAVLWISLGCGLILDILSSHVRFGLYAVAFTLTTAILYRQKRHFFADSISTLPLMTFLFSLISTLIHVILIHLFENSLPFSTIWLIKDVIIMPILDGIFAFSLYVLPFILFGKPARRGKDYFLQEE